MAALNSGVLNRSSLWGHQEWWSLRPPKPVPITLRIYNAWEWGDGWTRTNYTFLYDWFGDTFRYERTETEPPYGDIVRVFCSPFAMVNWALQYSDRVEVLEPESVREEVVEKIRKLNRKYGVDPDADN